MKTVQIIEDEVINRIVLTEWFKNNGWLVDESGNSVYTHDDLNQIPDLVVIGVGRHGLESKRLLELVKQRERNGSRIMLLHTCMGEKIKGYHGINLYAITYVKKPYIITELLKTANTFCETKMIPTKC